MKRTAAIISFVTAWVLLAIAISSWVKDQNASREHADAEFRHLQSGDYATMNEMIAADRAAEQTDAIEAIGGVIFLIAGFALWSKRRSE